MKDRILAWEGCKNIRDLGSLGTDEGRSTRLGALVRSDTPSRLTPAGWSALYAYGIRTIVTLRTDGMQEDELTVASPYPDLAVVQVAIEDVTDREFVEKWASTDLWCTPLYYADALQRWPERHAAAVRAIAQAQPGGVLFHCVRGQDRTGIITLLLLSLAGVRPEEILADYELSLDPERDEILEREHSSVQAVILGVLEGLNAEQYLQAGGASPDDLAAIRQRLLG